MVAGLGRSSVPPNWRPTEIGTRADLVVTGVGKANAAGAVGAALARGMYDRVLVVGIAGVLTGCEIELGRPASIERAVLADEGIETGSGFISIDEMGFPPIPGGCSIAADARMCAALERIGARATVATVSTCSGTDARALAVARRTGAGLEDMETAAVGLVCARMGVAWGACRVASNTTGERSGQRWDMGGALRGMGRIIGPSIEAVRGLLV